MQEITSHENVDVKHSQTCHREMIFLINWQVKNS